MYFDAADTAIADLAARVTTLEGQVGTCDVDLTPINAAIAQLQADIAALDARLDGVGAAAQG